MYDPHHLKSVLVSVLGPAASSAVNDSPIRVMISAVEAHPVTPHTGQVRRFYLARLRRSSKKLARRTASSRFEVSGFPVSSKPSQIWPVFGFTV